MSLRDIVPTDKEIVMREDDFIVSKTDLKGRITYGNKTFIEFSGFDEKDILGVQHNLIRQRHRIRLLCQPRAMQQQLQHVQSRA